MVVRRSRRNGRSDEPAFLVVGGLMSVFSRHARFRPHFIDGIVVEPRRVCNGRTPLARSAGFGIDRGDGVGRRVRRERNAIKWLWQRRCPRRGCIVRAPFVETGSRIGRIDHDPHVVEPLMLRAKAHCQHSNRREKAFRTIAERKSPPGKDVAVRALEFAVFACVKMDACPDFIRNPRRGRDKGIEIQNAPLRPLKRNAVIHVVARGGEGNAQGAVQNAQCENRLLHFSPPFAARAW